MRAYSSNLKSLLRRLLLLSLVAAPSWVVACLVPPQHIYRGHDELLNEARQVLLVEARAAADAPGGCRLEVIKSWKEPAPRIAPVACIAPTDEEWMTSFEAHTDPEFWNGRDGRLGVNPDCTVMRPAFNVGRRYLVLLGIAPDLKQFEEVAAERDRWLAHVERRLGPGRSPSMAK